VGEGVRDKAELRPRGGGSSRELGCETSLEVLSAESGSFLGFDRACLNQSAILPRGFLDRERGAEKEDDDAIVWGSKLTP